MCYSKDIMKKLALGILMTCIVGCGEAKPGPVGPQGDTGDMGEPGTPGVDGSHVDRQVHSNPVLELEGSTVAFDYVVTIFANDNVFASGTVQGVGNACAYFGDFDPRRLTGPLVFESPTTEWTLSMDYVHSIRLIVSRKNLVTGEVTDWRL
jgi:hypothetical protein